MVPGCHVGDVAGQRGLPMCGRVQNVWLGPDGFEWRVVTGPLMVAEPELKQLA